MLRGRPRRLRGWSVNRMIPNGLTVLALCAGLTAIRFALEERWDMAVLAIVIAAVFDVLDGRAARLLKVTSRFGAELDSLSDFISFGAAPAVLIYQWTLSDVRGLGWAMALLFAVCCALRLARFNSEMEQPEADRPPWMRNYLVGVPAPAAAGLAIVPVMIWLELGTEIARLPAVNGIVVTFVALLMISRVPTLSNKRFTVPINYVLPVLLVVGLMFAALVSAPWPTLIFFGLGYLLSIPVTMFISHRQKTIENSKLGLPGEPEMAESSVEQPAAAGLPHKGNGDAGARP